ncbi:MAG: hypothetical protein K2X93_25445 [Candidatus Obscuribacterales bacterium]|nr:hypothetical protein [Candidatus Obscuribacterales bacterium]
MKKTSPVTVAGSVCTEEFTPLSAAFRADLQRCAKPDGQSSDKDEDLFEGAD